MLEFIWPPYSLFSSFTASFYYLYHIPPQQALSPRLVWCWCWGPLPPFRVKSCIICGVGGQENRFQVQYGVYGRVRSVRYLQSLLHGSTVPARVGIRRHIGTESYRFGQQYGASDRVVWGPQANRHGAYRFMRWQYGASDGSCSLDNLGIGCGYLWRQQYDASDRFRWLRIIQVLDVESFGSRFGWWQYGTSDKVISQAYWHEAYQFRQQYDASTGVIGVLA